MGRRHYWSPALVAWFGFGRGSIGFGYGNIGWVPLAPYETFHPWWGRGYYGRGFNRNINITNINIVNNYRNARFGNGISGVGYNDFHSGRFNGISRFSGAQVREAGLIRGQMPIAPSRSHVQYTERSAAFVPQATRNTQFFSRSRVSTPQRIPFEQQRQAFGGARQDTGARLGNSGRQSAVVAQGGFENTRPAQAAPQSRGGWQRFGEPSTRQAGPSNRFENTRPSQSQSTPQSRGSWQRFGEPGSASRAQPRSSYESGSPSGGQRFGTPGGNVVRERSMPRSYEAPGGGSQRGFGSGSMPRSYEAPGGGSQRGFGSGSMPRNYESPGRFGGGSPRSYEAPRSAPRGGFGGGGSYSAPSRGGGGGGFSAPPPRSSGGGSSRGFNAPAPRSSGGGNSRGSFGGGGGGSRPSGGGGGSRSGGHGRR
jgi:hypothetical protein